MKMVTRRGDALQGLDKMVAFNYVGIGLLSPTPMRIRSRWSGKAIFLDGTVYSMYITALRAQHLTGYGSWGQCIVGNRRRRGGSDWYHGLIVFLLLLSFNGLLVFFFILSIIHLPTYCIPTNQSST